MAKVLLKLDNPSDICKKFEDEFSYAVLVDNIADLDEEGKRMIIYHTKEDFEQGKGCATFPTGCMYENWFEYDAHFQLYDQERSLEMGESFRSLIQLEDALLDAEGTCTLFSIDGYFKDDKTEFYGYIVTSWDSVPDGLEEEEIFYFGINYDDLLHNLTTGGDDNLEFVVTEIRFLEV